MNGLIVDVVDGIVGVSVGVAGGVVVGGVVCAVWRDYVMWWWRNGSI